MYSKFGRPKWILVGQLLKLVGKWPMADLFLALELADRDEVLVLEVVEEGLSRTEGRSLP